MSSYCSRSLSFSVYLIIYPFAHLIVCLFISIPFYFSLSFCWSVYISACLPICLIVNSFVCLSQSSLYLVVYLCVFLFINLPSVCSSIYIHVYLFACSIYSICLSLRHSVYLFVCLHVFFCISTYLSVYLSVCCLSFIHTFLFNIQSFIFLFLTFIHFHSFFYSIIQSSVHSSKSFSLADSLMHSFSFTNSFIYFHIQSFLFKFIQTFSSNHSSIFIHCYSFFHLTILDFNFSYVIPEI